MAQPLTATEMLARLIGFDTVSAHSNLALIDFVADYLDGNGARVRLIHDDAGTKANLYATCGPERGGGVVLSGHTDVVPVAGQNWASDPFALAQRDDRLIGRGTADMKGFIACALAALPRLKQAAHTVPIHYALSYDEEIGCLGAPRMIAGIIDAVERPAAVIVGEPTAMEVVDSHKGITVLTTSVRGRDGHSSRPADGVNAVSYAAEIIGFLSRLADQLARAGGPDRRFDPPHTTINIGTIRGGTTVNMIAAECHFQWEFRAVPGAPPEAVIDRLAAFVETAIVPRMRAIDPTAGVVTEIERNVGALAPDPDSPAVKLALALTGANAAGAAAFVCEAGLFHRAGLPVAICGPGTVREAHQPNEFVTVDQLARCDAFLTGLAARMAAA